MLELADKNIVQVDVKSDGLYLLNASIYSNWMGGYFPLEWLNRYSESLGNCGYLTFAQIADFFDAHNIDESNHNGGIYTAISLSKYMTDNTNALVSAKSILDNLRKELVDTSCGHKDNLYYSAISFRDAIVKKLTAASTKKYGETKDVLSEKQEKRQLKNIATNKIKKIIFSQIYAQHQFLPFAAAAEIGKALG